MSATFHIENFGCRAARADGEAVGERLRAAQLAEGQCATADVVVVNTCSVTAEADREARAFIRRTHRMNPAARIVATGCYAQRAPEDLAGMEGVAAVVGNSHKALVPEIVLGLARDEGGARVGDGWVNAASLLAGSGVRVLADETFAHSFLEEAQVAPGTQTRPNLKIQEGCGNRCSFCVIPQTRGSSRSLDTGKVLRQVEGFVAAGGKELVFSGINLGRWGRDLASAPSLSGDDHWSPTHSPDSRRMNGAPNLGAADTRSPTLSQRGVRKDGARNSLADLVRQIFVETELPRLRLSSIEPMDWDADLVGLMAEFGGTRLARHAHLPLQSGSDAVLRRMHRRYRPWHYADKVAALVKTAGPGLTLGADVMVGFPGETDAEFEETLELVRALPFGYLHLFPFSPRPGTKAWALHAAAPVAPEAVQERMAELRGLAAEKIRAHRMQFVGMELEAITLHTPVALGQQSRTAALTENFLPVELEGDFAANELVRVRVKGLQPDSVLTASSAEKAVELPALCAAD